MNFIVKSLSWIINNSGALSPSNWQLDLAQLNESMCFSFSALFRTSSSQTVAPSSSWWDVRTSLSGSIVVKSLFFLPPPKRNFSWIPLWALFNGGSRIFSLSRVQTNFCVYLDTKMFLCWQFILVHAPTAAQKAPQETRFSGIKNNNIIEQQFLGTHV